uniref:major tail protein n=1 Tax=Enterocloster citroniae TaxID=358743 RepID=UPI001898A689
NGAITFATPVRVPGAVSIALDAQGDISKFYADGITYYQAAANNGYDGDLEVALLPESFRTDVLGETLDGKKVLVENADAKQTAFALLFEFDGDEKAIRHVLYNCTSTRPSVESQTKEESIEPVTETLTISATPLPDGRIKARTGDTTDEATYGGWYDEVYETTASGPSA